MYVLEVYQTFGETKELCSFVIRRFMGII